MAPSGTYAISTNDLIRTNEMAQELGVKINLHLLEVAADRPQAMAKHQMQSIQLLESIGMLSPSLIAIHMTQVNDAEIELFKKYKPNIVHCPESNMKLASGACPVDHLLKNGINVALGTDGAASNNDLDMIGEMRSAGFLGKLTARDPKALPAETILKMATLHGARALGIDHLTGSLTAGKAADFIAIDLEQLETEPLYHPASQIVYAAGRNQVTDVWVNGKELLKNRQLMTLDEQALLEKAQSWRKKLKN
jgi:5-methylthioadenosine/S-adenosylhomocysteine deaminase